MIPHITILWIMTVADMLEKPFIFDWALGPADDRVLGQASVLPFMAIAYFVSLTILKPFAGAAWLQKG